MHILRFGSAISLGAIVVLGFQNCGAPEQKETPAFEDFALSAKADTLGYMSCSEMKDADPSAYFTFRLGAYENGGLSLSEEFHDATAGMSPNKKTSFLIEGDKNKDVQMQLAIRRSSDMVAFASENTAKEGFDFAYIFPPVNNSDLVGKLINANSGEHVRTLPGSLDKVNRFEGTLNFSDSQVLEESVRSELRRGAYLAITYNPIKEEFNADKTLAIAPGDFKEEPTALDFSAAFGTGLDIDFQQGNIGSGHPARVMSSIEEVDLLTKKSEGGLNPWVCPANMRLKIVRPEDVGVSVNDEKVVNCDRVLDPQEPSKDLERIRRVLKVEDWYVDMKNRCVVPKAGRVGSCYGEQTQVEYTNAGCGGTAACTHFFSLCYRAF